jgi:glutaredoxin
VLRGLAVVVFALVACRERHVPADAAPLSSTVPIARDAEVIYVDVAGRMQRAFGVDAVPVASRHVVGIEGPDGPGGAVWFADVSIPQPEWAARRVSHRELERRALAALPPATGSGVTFPPPSDVAPPADGVVVYGTAWCAACRDARAWLDARGVAYRFRDVERDATAAADAAARCATLAVTPDRVPVIDVAGRVVLGFDPDRLTSILGEPI